MPRNDRSQGNLPEGCVLNAWHSSNDDREAIGTGGLRKGKTSPTWSNSFVRLRVLRQWYWTSALCVLLFELNNLGHRIRWALEIRTWELGDYRGQCPLGVGKTLDSQCRICRPVYILYMQQLSNLQPTHTVVDSYLVSQAWWAGWRSARRMGRTQNQQGKCSSYSPLRGSYLRPKSFVAELLPQLALKVPSSFRLESISLFATQISA